MPCGSRDLGIIYYFFRFCFTCVRLPDKVYIGKCFTWFEALVGSKINFIFMVKQKCPSQTLVNNSQVIRIALIKTIKVFYQKLPRNYHSSSWFPAKENDLVKWQSSLIEPL